MQTNERLSLIKIENPFVKQDRTYESIPYFGENLLEIRNIHFPMETGVVVSVNGVTVPEDQLETYKIRNNDQILFIPRIEGGGGGGKNILRIVLMIAVIAIAAWAAPGVAGFMGITGKLGIALVGAGLTMVGSYLVNTLLPPQIPEVNATGQSASQSQVYSWSPQTTQQQGLPVPRVYGTHKLYGNVINTYLENLSDDKQNLNVLLCLGMGPFSSIYDYYINDQPIKNISGVEINTTLGRLTNPLIPNFNDTKTEYSVAIKVPDSTPHTYTTIGDDFDGLEVDVTFPNGLYYANDKGGLDTISFSYKIEISPTGAGTWTSITKSSVTTTTIAANTWSAGYWDNNEPPSWHQVAAGTNVYADHYDGEYHSYAEGHSCFWRWMSGNELVADSIVDYVTVSSNKTSALRRTHKCQIDAAAHGQYDIKVTSLTADSSDVRRGDDFYFTAVREVETSDFIYPRLSLVGIKALATDQLSGSLRFSCMVDGQLVNVYDGATWNVEFSNNPAWICYDILTQPVIKDDNSIDRYEGIDPSRLDTAAFYAWASWCDTLVPDGKGGTEKRFTFNGVFDSEKTMWESAWDVCQQGRAALVWRGRNITIVIDKAETPVQLFSVGNIKNGSFKETFLSLDDRASELEIDFTNNEKGYERDRISVFNSGLNRPSNKTSIQMIGCTKASEAWRHAYYRLLNNQYIIRTIEFDVDIDSLACTVGDVIRIQHDIPQWGYGGRVVSATNDSVTFDREVTIAALKTYQVAVRKANSDSVEVKTVTSGAGTSNTISIAPATWTSNPALYDIWSFGEVDIAYKNFRIKEIRRAGDQTANITALEYRSEIYADDLTGIPDIPDPDWSALDSYVDLDDLSVVFRAPLDQFDVGRPRLEVSFTAKDTAMFKSADVYYKKDGETRWNFAGNTNSFFYLIEPVDYSSIYIVKVRGINNLGVKTPLDDNNKCPFESITTSEMPDYYNKYLEWKISGLRVDGDPHNNNFTGRDCVLVWNDITSVDQNNTGAGEEPLGAGPAGNRSWFKCYEVKIVNYIEQTVRRTEYVETPKFTYTYEMNSQDGNGTPTRTFDVEVRAVDIAYRLTRQPARIQVTNPAPDMGSSLPSITAFPTGIKISWARCSDIDLAYYDVYCDTNNPPTTYVTRVGADTLSYSIFGLTPLTNYYAKVIPVDAFGAGTASQIPSGQPSKMPYESVDVELVGRLVITDSLGSTDLTSLIDNDLSSGGIAYSSGDWIKYEFPIQQIQNGIWFVSNSSELKTYVSIRPTTVDSWTYLKASTDHSLSSGRLIVAADSSDAKENYWLSTAADGNKIFALYPNGLTGRECRLHIESSGTIRELRFVDQVIAEQITANNLAAISADLGNITAGSMQSSAYPVGLFMDVAAGYINVTDDSSILRVKIGRLTT